jgi:hypothetical protein
MSEVISQYFSTTVLRRGQRAMALTANLIFRHGLRRRKRCVRLEVVPGTKCLQEVSFGNQKPTFLLVSLDNANL